MLFNAKFFIYIYIYIYNLRFLNEFFVDNILKKEDLIGLYTIKWFQVSLSNNKNLFWHCIIAVLK